ncbi:MAG: hypothetical protein LRY27_00910 [Chitinophagales bacterium]|nr:hypothetical protein [Chitinophagales bacterium]
MSNISLKQIAFIAASVLTVFGIIVFALISVFHIGLTFLHVVVLSVITFGISYFIFYRLIDAFVYKRIKILYKNIHHLKSGKAFKEIQNQDDPLSVVEEQVKEFNISKTTEIAELKKWKNTGAIFRQCKPRIENPYI